MNEHLADKQVSRWPGAMAVDIPCLISALLAMASNSVARLTADQ